VEGVLYPPGRIFLLCLAQFIRNERCEQANILFVECKYVWLFRDLQVGRPLTAPDHLDRGAPTGCIGKIQFLGQSAHCSLDPQQRPTRDSPLQRLCQRLQWRWAEIAQGCSEDAIRHQLGTAKITHLTGVSLQAPEYMERQFEFGQIVNEGDKLGEQRLRKADVAYPAGRETAEHPHRTLTGSELNRLLTRLGIEELSQPVAEEELHGACGAVPVFGDDDVGNVLPFGLRVV